jgi:hypothetical protein
MTSDNIVLIAVTDAVMDDPEEINGQQSLAGRPCRMAGNDNYPDSMLDFAFVSGPANDWKTVCKVIISEGLLALKDCVTR